MPFEMSAHNAKWAELDNRGSLPNGQIDQRAGTNETLLWHSQLPIAVVFVRHLIKYFIVYQIE